MKKAKLKVIKAKNSGFCFGVKRAVGIAESFLKRHKKAYSLGPVIHNPAVVKALSRRGLEVISDISRAKGKYLLIRSHGISPRLKKKAQALSISMVDATCPLVKRSHNIVTQLKRQNYYIVVIGEKSHPEVKALSEAAGRRCAIIEKDADLKVLRINSPKLAIVAQTTLSRNRFLDIASGILGMKYAECRVFDTICKNVAQRQAEAQALAKSADVVVVAGGKMSANTRHIAQICRRFCSKTYHIESARHFSKSWLKGAGSLAVVSGASTPVEIVDEIISTAKNLK